MMYEMASCTGKGPLASFRRVISVLPLTLSMTMNPSSPRVTKS
jgi:hypothetical protein